MPDDRSLVNFLRTEVPNPSHAKAPFRESTTMDFLHNGSLRMLWLCPKLFVCTCQQPAGSPGPRQLPYRDQGSCRQTVEDLLMDRKFATRLV